MDRNKPRVQSDHHHLDARSLAMHRIIASKLLVDPAVIDQARNTLARWRAQAAEPVPAYFTEWERILEGSPRRSPPFWQAP